MLRIPPCAICAPFAIALFSTMSALPHAAASSMGVARLRPAQYESGQQTFGDDIAAHGDLCAIGNAAAENGAVHLFRRAGDGAWREEAVLSGPKGSTWFGAGLDAHSDRVVVTALTAPERGPAEPIRVLCVFEQAEDGEWRQVALLTGSTSHPGDDFGHALAMNDNLIVASAPGNNHAGEESGVVFVFRRSPEGEWGEEARLAPSDAEAEIYFGSGLDLSEGRIAVAAPLADGAGPRLGALYIFERQPRGVGKWAQTARLHAAGVTQIEAFGEDVAISGDMIVAGAFLAGAPLESAGAAYVFERQSNGQWTELPPLVASDRQAHSWFGRPFAIDGDALLIGASRGAGVAHDRFGATYLFRRVGSAWVESAKFCDPGADKAVHFGTGIAIQGRTVFVSRNGRDAFNGEVVVIDLLEPLGFAGDCNNNGASDLVDLFLHHTSADCNDNGIPDECDIASGLCADVDMNGVPDECEAASACSGDLNGDGQTNASDLGELLGRWGPCP